MGITEAAREYLGVPFKHQGRNRAGLDCAGLVMLACADVGFSPVGCCDYRRSAPNGVVEETLSKNPWLQKLPKQTALQKDDILAFRIAEDAQHLAIFTSTGIIHAYSTAGKVSEHKFVSFWKTRLAAVYRVKADD